MSLLLTIFSLKERDQTLLLVVSFRLNLDTPNYGTRQRDFGFVSAST
jgi:hypothetical protein